jgi:hypothetical protein
MKRNGLRDSQKEKTMIFLIETQSIKQAFLRRILYRSIDPYGVMKPKA